VVRSRAPARAGAAVAIELLRRGEALRIRARGASMLPFVRDRDVLDVDPAVRGRLRPGDLVCYESEPGVLQIHRLVAHGPAGVFVRGDALSHGEWVSPADVLGGVVALERRGRRRPCPGGAVRRRLALCLAPVLAPLVERALHLRGAWRRGR
jgi:hypothetical protein